MNNLDSDQTDPSANPERRKSVDSSGSAFSVKSGVSVASSPAKPGRSRIISLFCLIGAGVCLILGTLGFFLPVIPGTPFVLLASFLLLKGSPRLHQRLKDSKFFGRILRDWEERGGIRPRDKIRAIVIVILGACFSFVFGPQQRTIQLAALGFIMIGLWVILRLPLAKE